jgi:hypothetical protein
MVEGYVFYPSIDADYDLGDFEADTDKMTYLCSKCHKEIKNCKCRKKSKGKKKQRGQIEGWVLPTRG